MRISNLKTLYENYNKEIDNNLTRNNNLMLVVDTVYDANVVRAVVPVRSHDTDIKKVLKALNVKWTGMIFYLTLIHS